MLRFCLAVSHHLPKQVSAFSRRRHGDPSYVGLHHPLRWRTAPSCAGLGLAVAGSGLGLLSVFLFFVPVFTFLLCFIFLFLVVLFHSCSFLSLYLACLCLLGFCSSRSGARVSCLSGLGSFVSVAGLGCSGLFLRLGGSRCGAFVLLLFRLLLAFRRGVFCASFVGSFLLLVWLLVSCCGLGLALVLALHCSFLSRSLVLGLCLWGWCLFCLVALAALLVGLGLVRPFLFFYFFTFYFFVMSLASLFSGSVLPASVVFPWVFTAAGFAIYHRRFVASAFLLAHHARLAGIPAVALPLRYHPELGYACWQVVVLGQ